MAHTEADRSRCVGQPEQHLLVTAITSDGITLLEDDPRELLRLPAVAQPPSLLSSSANSALSSDVEARKTELLREINQRNLGYFEQEVQKLDAWADDLKLGLEQEIKEIDRQIKEVRSTAATAPTLEEKLSGRRSNGSLRASEASSAAICSPDRTKWKHSATGSSASWNCSFNSKWRSTCCSPSSGN